VACFQYVLADLPKAFIAIMCHTFRHGIRFLLVKSICFVMAGIDRNGLEKYYWNMMADKWVVYIMRHKIAINFGILGWRCKTIICWSRP